MKIIVHEAQCTGSAERAPAAGNRPLSCCFALGLAILAACSVIGCREKEPVAEQPVKPAVAADTSLVSDAAGAAPGTLVLPTGFGKRTGDLDDIAKARVIRALVIVNPVGFFYQAGHPQGIQYEALEEFEKFANKKLNTGKLPLKVVFLPMRPDQVEPALTQGLGDIIAHGVIITPEREQRLAFSIPVNKDVKEVVVTGPALANVASFDDLAGKDIYVNPLTVYKDYLNRVADDQKKSGKQPLIVKDADVNLFDDDLVQMVNAGIIPATITNQPRADLWAQVLPNVKSHTDLAVASGLNMGWVMRKSNPQLKQLVDEFFESRAAGSAFGNTLLRRYLQNTKWITNSTNAAELQKFNDYSGYFKKYSSQYNFDYLMIAAQAYQESLLDQDRRSHAGAVGVMQVIPKLAAANPINIPNVGNADGNIQAGTKMLRNIADTYFNDPGINPLNKTLFTFASYNAGPNRIVRLRKKAQQDGLDPNKWFGNVELEVAQDVGQETVNYVSNIYKYYVAYKLTLEEKQQKPTTVASK
jgi:membrane-bound lytic murein transglycosylase MltF